MDNTSSSASPPAPSSNTTFVRAPIKRARPQLSCAPCRQGKLKCNREQPVCDQCSKRARHDACRYVPPPQNKRQQNMRGRIRNLEDMVVNLLNQKEQEQKANGTSDSESKPTKDKQGQLRISNSGNEANYVGAYHWSAVLQEIEDVKTSLDEGAEDDLEEEDENEEWNSANARSSLTFGLPRALTKTQLIQALPRKEEADFILPLWFNSTNPILYIIHGPTFQTEYNKFWEDPASASVMWIALFYSILSLGIILGPRNPGRNAYAAAYDRSSGSSYDKKDPTNFLASTADRFQQLASSALALADISRSHPYTLEALMIYAECEFLRRDDHDGKIWLMNGITLRVAMRMGVHREPSNFGNLTPFQCEMRRRVWHTINMMDNLISFGIGLPGLVRCIESDVQPPGNYYDSDISPSMTEFPKERPVNEITPATYTIAKCRISEVFAEVAELSHKIKPPEYDKVLSLQAKLEEVHNSMPAVMRVRTLEESINDAPRLIMSRLNIELVYLKTKLILHRIYLTAGQRDPRYAESRRICVESAIDILNHHITVFHACQPGGQLATAWWYISSLQTYDYLLAAMVLSLEIHHLMSSDPSSPKVSEILKLLQVIYDIWSNNSTRFREVVRGAAILKSVLEKYSWQTKENGTNSAQPNAQTLDIGTLPSDTTTLTSEATVGQQSPINWNAWPPNDSPTNLSSIPSGIDWTVWDSIMQHQDVMLPPQNWAMSPSNFMETWMGATQSVDSAIANGFEGFQNFEAQPGVHGPTLWAPGPEPMS
ncbi:unnamed protein product [Periconia digitata]|uniref:Zn(2)-C6 fungal-type domain-containing protein n=1 Tax=Periconia digitata TaxID=1303443 RepID=A0A9W4XR78_9PLEO|nr:unnamed protein product [Periconia digitata]